jgi:hypothetical protein
VDETECNRRWVEHWRRVGPILEKARHDELRAMTHEQSLLVFQAVADLAFGSPPWPVRTTSGFVEQQRQFLKMRSHGAVG